MLTSKKVVNAINKQIGNEFGASLQYVAIAAYFSGEAFRNWPNISSSRRPRKTITRCVLSNT